MKKWIATSLIMLSIGYAATAQCRGKISWNAAKAEIVDSSGKLLETLPGKVLVETTQTDILMRHDEAGADDLKGNIRDLVCSWKEPFRNGKTVFRADLVNAGGDVRPATVTIEGVDGKITITAVPDHQEGKKIKIVVDSFKENN
ncbi:MAG TPA: hypothetical protein VMI35_05780 [Puia sp.]|nr:hypothetical protein [Puia sp.]